jgi:hypothetical protein
MMMSLLRVRNGVTKIVRQRRIGAQNTLVERIPGAHFGGRCENADRERCGSRNVVTHSAMIHDLVFEMRTSNENRSANLSQVLGSVSNSTLNASSKPLDH